MPKNKLPRPRHFPAIKKMLNKSANIWATTIVVLLVITVFLGITIYFSPSNRLEAVSASAHFRPTIPNNGDNNGVHDGHGAGPGVNPDPCNDLPPNSNPGDNSTPCGRTCVGSNCGEYGETCPDGTLKPAGGVCPTHTTPGRSGGGGSSTFGSPCDGGAPEWMFWKHWGCPMDEQ